MDAKRSADRYISRGGGSPTPNISEHSSDILTVASFIAWHDPHHMRGGATTDEAFAALCRLLNFERHVLMKIVRGESDTP